MEPAMYPSKAQLGLLDEGFAADEPLWMISLQRFREHAVYSDPVAPGGTLSGREAYALYGQGLRPLVETAGGRVVAIGELRGLFIGSGDLDYDLVTILEFPNRRVWLDLMSSPEVRALSAHREAALESQLLFLAAARSEI